MVDPQTLTDAQLDEWIRKLNSPRGLIWDTEKICSL